MKNTFAKYLSIMAILLLVLNSLPLQNVHATVGEKDTKEATEESNEYSTESSIEKTESQENQQGNIDDESEEDSVEENATEEDDQNDESPHESEDNSKESESNDDDEQSKTSETDDSKEERNSSETEVKEEPSDSEEETEAFEDSSLNGEDSSENNEEPDKDKSSEKEDNQSLDMLSDSYKESKTSKLAHLRAHANIYKTLGDEDSKVSVEQFTHAVYYVKKQAEVGSETFYLLSTSPSSTKNLLGWVNGKELDIRTHKTVDNTSKKMYLTGKGKAYSKAWGGKKDLVQDDLSSHKAKLIKINLTETVGNNTWYRGKLNGKTVWVHSSSVTQKEESKTSKLAHLRGHANIYKTLGDVDSKISTNKYTHAVYYVKKQAKLANETFYLLSTSPSSTKDLLGWVNAKELDARTHKTVDKNSKEMYFTGKGKAYSKAWGGKKDLVQDDLSSHKAEIIKINLTETVGNNTWYRGKLNGKTVWVHSSSVTQKEESKTSKLAHLRGHANIYKTLGDVDSKISTNKYTHAVYYVKKQAKLANETFYLLSTSPSSTKDLLGWVNAKELDARTHKTVDKNSKEMYFTGKGKAYSKAWGGNKNLVHSNMSSHRGKVFKINLTEKVGNNIWYRGKFGGETIWLHSSNVEKEITGKYNLTLEEAVDIQMKVDPQTDQKYAYVSKKYIKNNKVTASTLNVRLGAGTKYGKVGALDKGASVKIISDTGNGWYQIKFNPDRQWVNAARQDVKYHLDPKNFIEHKKLRFQFLDLSKTTSASAQKLNKSLSGKGVLKGQGQSFIDAGNKYGVNDLYLISHALLETGNGTSKLAKGIEVGLNSSKKPTVVNNSNRNSLKQIKKVYNMYGIGAYDNCALECGAQHAYNENWTSPKKAIIGGAKFIREGYIARGQNTLYKMRWNPKSMSENGTASHQYATDIGWASKQVNTMYNLYNEFGISSLNLEIPVYK